MLVVTKINSGAIRQGAVYPLADLVVFVQSAPVVLPMLAKLTIGMIGKTQFTARVARPEGAPQFIVVKMITGQLLAKQRRLLSYSAAAIAF